MLLEGRLKKVGRCWLAEVPALDLQTQGTSRRQALVRLGDAVRQLVARAGFQLQVSPASDGGAFTVGSNDAKLLLALLLRRQRQKRGLTLRQVAGRLGAKSANAVARYEQARVSPTMGKLQELVRAINPRLRLVLSVN